MERVSPLLRWHIEDAIEHCTIQAMQQLQHDVGSHEATKVMTAGTKLVVFRHTPTALQKWTASQRLHSSPSASHSADGPMEPDAVERYNADLLDSSLYMATLIFVPLVNRLLHRLTNRGTLPPSLNAEDLRLSSPSCLEWGCVLSSRDTTSLREAIPQLSQRATAVIEAYAAQHNASAMTDSNMHQLVQVLVSTLMLFSLRARHAQSDL